MNKLIAILLLSTVTCFGGSKFVRGNFVSGAMPYIVNGLLNSLQAYWKLEETAGNNRVSQINANNVFLDNGSAFNSVTGKINNAANYPSVEGSDVLYCAAPTIDTTSNWSLSGWAYINSASLFIAQEIIASINTYNGSPQIFIQSNGFLNFEKNSDGDGSILTSTYPTDTWIYLTMTYDSSTGTVSGYVNGTLIGISTSVSLFSTSIEIDLFNNGTGGTGTPGSNSSFAGKIDEWGFWNKCLTQNDINKLYNSGNALPFGSFTN